MTEWLDAALSYATRWLDYQMQQTQLPGCVLAVAKNGNLILERAYGVSDLATGEPLTPRHRFRVASHSKTFTAAGIMKLREQGRLHLDDNVGAYVTGLHVDVASATISQLLSHSAGVMRDGTQAPHWMVREPFFDRAKLFEELAEPPAIEGNTRFKYSNVGYGLLGQVIEAISGEAYGVWIEREVVVPFGLGETTHDMPSTEVPLAAGHSGRIPFGRGRIEGHQATHALAAATGFTSTAADLARFFSLLHPKAPTSALSPVSRKEMTRRHWSVIGGGEPRHYGLGIIGMDIGKHALFGHAGSFPGFISRTSVVEANGISLTIVTNAVDGFANAWVEGIVSIFNIFEKYGKPEERLADWAFRLWSLWGALDLVPAGDKILFTDPGALRPLTDHGEITVQVDGSAHISKANGFGSFGEPVRRCYAPDGGLQQVLMGGNGMLANASDLAIFPLASASI